MRNKESFMSEEDFLRLKVREARLMLQVMTGLYKREAKEVTAAVYASETLIEDLKNHEH